MYSDSSTQFHHQVFPIRDILPHSDIELLRMLVAVVYNHIYGCSPGYKQKKIDQEWGSQDYKIQ